MCFSDILTSLSGRPSICSRVALLLVATPLAGLLSCAWWLTVWSPVHGPREPTSGYVKLLLPPRQSRGNSLVGLAKFPFSSSLRAQANPTAGRLRSSGRSLLPSQGARCLSNRALCATPSTQAPASRLGFFQKAVAHRTFGQIGVDQGRSARTGERQGKSHCA